MPIQTRGAEISVIPRLAQIDTSQLVNPQNFLQGALGSLQLANANQALQAQRQQLAEQQASQADRLAQIRALSQLQQLAEAKQEAIQPGQVDVANTGANLQAATNVGELQSLPAVQQTQLAELGLKKKQAELGTTYAEANASAQRDLLASEAARNRGDAARFQAMANYYSNVKGQNQTADPSTKAYMTKVGNIAAALGKTPEWVAQVFNSGIQGQKVDRNGNPSGQPVPIASELAALAENLSKPVPYLNPYDDISPQLRQAMGADGLARYQSIHPQLGTNTTIPSGNVTPAAVPYALPASQPGQTVPYQQASPNVIRIDKGGNIIRPDQKQSSAQTAPQQAPQPQDATDMVSNASDLLADGPLLKGLSVTPNLTMRAAARLAALRLGQAAPTVLSGLGQGLGAAGAAALSAPVSAAYYANKYGGRMLGGAMGVPDENMSGGVLRGLAAPSFDEQLQDANYDALSQRINQTLRSTSLTDEQKQSTLHDLLNQRDILWTKMQGSAGNQQPDIFGSSPVY